MQVAKLISISEYRDLRFTGRRPAASTLRRWIEDGELPGRRIGGCYYVDLDAEQKRTGNSIADAILETLE